MKTTNQNQTNQNKQTNKIISRFLLIATENIDLIYNSKTFIEGKHIHFNLEKSLVLNTERIKFNINSPLDFLNCYLIKHETETLVLFQFLIGTR